MFAAVASTPNFDDPELAAQWRTPAYTPAATASPFLSWEWVGCLARERYPDPVLITTFDHGQPVGLALFNRRRTRWATSLHLHESGDAALDSVYIEHNGVLSAPHHQAAVLAATLDCARALASRIVLHGIDDAGLAAACATNGVIGGLKTSLAPFLPLAPGDTLMPSLSRNTRAQLRRSDRSYAAHGPITVDRAESLDVALDWLEHLVVLHTATWSARGMQSGFAQPATLRFHRALLARGVPTGLVDLLRITAGPEVIGYLLNLTAGGHTTAYQSGFAYARAGPHGKPGLTCHAAAIDHARAQGVVEYDFLAGDNRYKRSLATHTRNLHWLDLSRPASLSGLATMARRLVRR